MIAYAAHDLVADSVVGHERMAAALLVGLDGVQARDACGALQIGMTIVVARCHGALAAGGSDAACRRCRIARGS